MGELWKSIEGHVVTALITLIPIVATAVGAWIRSKTRKWHMAQDSALEAAELGARFNSEVPDEILEAWAVAAMNRRAQEAGKLKDGEALQLVRKVRDKLKQSSGHNGNLSASGAGPITPIPDATKSDPPTG
jgi:hypothetical protein